SKFTHSLLETRVVFCQDRSRRPAQNSDPPHLPRHLRPRHQRPSCRAEPRNELPPSHSITPSATASRFGGTSSPSARAVLRLMTISYLVGVCTGRSAGFSPRRTRST